MSDSAVVLADLRWYMDGRDGRTAFEERHIDGAVWVDLDVDLSARDQPATAGRHPLPSPEAFARAMSALGIGDETTVIAYDDTGGMTAGRLVVMLRMIGRDAALLDGGLGAWPGPTGSGPAARPAPASFTPRPWPPALQITADQAAAGDLLLDARAAPRFTGEMTAIDPRPGHIPGARNAPWGAALDPATGRFRSRDALVEHYRSLGVTAGDEAIAYCGSGVSACVNLLAMEHAGLGTPALYVASWSGWSADPDRPAELGPARQG
jgi:thiosulfate/3-mercaptopyruvate sulfurtransferase